jgi:DNA invertase Pin-like site-specific DNA recombinase
MVMVMAQFEREQTGEQNRDASLARAQRGLWNGGQLLGYDLPEEDKKGTLIPICLRKARSGSVLSPVPGEYRS